MATVPHPGVELVEAISSEQAEQARALFLEYAESLDFSLCFQSFDEEVKNLPGAYAPPTGRLLLALQQGQSAGCVALRLLVRPAYRGEGLGQMLVERVIAEARAIGYERMRLDTVASSMQDAVALYQRRGFREIEPYRTNPIAGAIYLE